MEQELVVELGGHRIVLTLENGKAVKVVSPLPVLGKQDLLLVISAPSFLQLFSFLCD